MMKLASTTALAGAITLRLSGLALAQAPQPGVSQGQPAMQHGSQQSSQPGAQQGRAAQAGVMSEDAMRTALRVRGYSDLNDIERDGDTFKVGSAKRYGEDVSDLRVNARTGQVRDESRLSEDQAKNLLDQRGYSDVSDVNRDGDTIRAKAKQGDREVNLRIDARSGVVTQQQASN